MGSRRKSPIEIKVTEVHMCSVDLRLEILAKVPFFQALSAAELEQVNSKFRELGYEPGEFICLAGDPAERLFVVAEGRVRLLRHSLTGKDILLDLLAPGEFFGSLSALGDEYYPETAQAQTSVCTLVVSKDAFQQILEQYPSVAVNMIGIMAARLRSANEHVQHLSVLPVEGRIANVLLTLSRKFGEPHEQGRLIQVPLSREDMAAMTGTTSESASRVMSQFQKDGLISTGRQWVAVTDQPGLEVIAGKELE